MPPSGRIKKPMPKVAVVSSSEAYRLSAGSSVRIGWQVSLPSP
jgi:hypothetical protein